MKFPFIVEVTPMFWHYGPILTPKERKKVEIMKTNKDGSNGRLYMQAHELVLSFGKSERLYRGFEHGVYFVQS